MKAEILCSSRELFGADRSAMRLAGVLADVGADVTLVVPAQRPDLGLDDEARRRGLAVDVRPVAIASSRGVEAPRALVAARRGAPAADLTIHNTTAVLGAGRGGGRKVMMVREWLEPGSPKHRGVVALHRVGLTAVVGISGDVLAQWRACVRGPRVQALVPNWLEDDKIPAAPTVDPDAREGILFLGRFNDWKGQDVRADAYEQAFAGADARPSLTFVGAQPGTVFAAAAERLEARGRDGGWTVLPFAADPTPQLQRAALLVVPSLHPEPFGMVILEALARGCRVLAFPGGGATDLADPFAGALTVVPRTTADLAAALRAWADEGGAAQPSATWSGSLATLRASYSPAAAAGRWRRLLGEIG